MSLLTKLLSLPYIVKGASFKHSPAVILLSYSQSNRESKTARSLGRVIGNLYSKFFIAFMAYFPEKGENLSMSSQRSIPKLHISQPLSYDCPLSTQWGVSSMFPKKLCLLFFAEKVAALMMLVILYTPIWFLIDRRVKLRRMIPLPCISSKLETTSQKLLTFSWLLLKGLKATALGKIGSKTRQTDVRSWKIVYIFCIFSPIDTSFMQKWILIDSTSWLRSYCSTIRFLLNFLIVKRHLSLL